MIISYNKNITKLKNNKTIGITITLQRLLQSTKQTLRICGENVVDIPLLKNCPKKNTN